MSPTVSVVIPTYNRQDMVQRAIQTALDQTYPPHEVIVVDDCSTDATREVVTNYGDPRVKLVARTTNGGGSAARNDGIDAATGDYVALLDSDDVWQPEKLARQVAHLDTLTAKQRDFCIGYTNLQTLIYGEAGPVVNSRGIAAGESVADYLFLAGETIQTSSLLVSRRAAREVRFDPRLRRHQDWDFVLRAERAGVHFTYVADPLVLFRVDVGGDHLSRQGSVEPTLYWVNEAAPDLLTGRPRAAFMADWVMPRIVCERPLYVARWYVTALAKRTLPPSRFARLLVRQVVPYRLRLALKTGSLK
jgi:glycosyltransferase involved in cell wall biosynthesis